MTFLDQFWQYIIAAFAAVVWFIRLEDKTNANTKQIAADRKSFERLHEELEIRIEKRRAEDQVAAQNSRSEVIDALAIIQNDIKKLLQGQNK